MNHPRRRGVPASMRRVASTALALLFAAACRVPVAAPDYRFEYDGMPMRADFVPVEGDGGSPLPGDVLQWPDLVLDEVAEQAYVTAPGNRVFRRTSTGQHLVFIEVRDACDLAALSDGEAGGLRGISFSSWDSSIARELERVDARRCLFTFWPLSAVVDLAELPAETRYLNMHYSESVDPAGFARFKELRFLAVPQRGFIPEGEPPPEDDSPGPGIAVHWTKDLPELRWLDLDGVASDLRPLAGHPRLRTVLAAHCRITAMPTESMPELREFLAPFSDCPGAEVERMRRLHPEARVRTTPREVLLDCVGSATSLRLRTGASCHPRPSDRVVYATEDPAEIGELLDLLRPRSGYDHDWPIPGCDQGVMQFFSADGALLGEVGMIGRMTLRSYRAWDTTPALFESKSSAAALVEWLTVRGLRIRD
ncbi:MAG: hypothetical protein U1F60_03715 [Planctomycetota bacterium]